VATAQRLTQRYKLVAAEWFLDRTRGIPYFQQILVKNPNPVVIDAIFKNETIADPAVKEIRKFELDLDTITRGLTLTVDLNTDDGPVNLDEIVSP